jgi:hypothetical protein
MKPFGSIRESPKYVFFFFFNNIFLFTVDSCSRSFLSSYVKILPTTLLNLLIKWVIKKKKKKKINKRIIAFTYSPVTCIMLYFHRG